VISRVVRADHGIAIIRDCHPCPSSKGPRKAQVLIIYPAPGPCWPCLRPLPHRPCGGRHPRGRLISRYLYAGRPLATGASGCGARTPWPAAATGTQVQLSKVSLLLRKGGEHTYVVVETGNADHKMSLMNHNGIDVDRSEEVDRAHAT
jgi:hypothetical protein